MNNFVGLDTSNSINVILNANTENSSSHNTSNIPQTVNCLSLNTVICTLDTVPWYIIWQTGAIVDTATHKENAAVRSSAKPTPHSTILLSSTNIHQLRLHLNLPNS